MTNHDFLHALATICQANRIWSDSQRLAPLTQDWRKRYHGQAIAAVFPTTVSEVQAIVKLCQLAQVAIVAQGGNTSTCGAATPLAAYAKRQLIVNFKLMNRILELDTTNYSITVEAGCTLRQVQDAALNAGLYFPLSLASQDSCQIGGNLATNAGGSQVLKYGMIRELCLGLSAVLADGNYLNQLHTLRKNNCYLDLKQLLIGSEGTLGLICQASLKLYPQIPQYVTLCLGLSSLDQALILLAKLRHRYTNNVAAFEIISQATLDIYKQYYSSEWPLAATAYLALIELEVNADFQHSGLIELLASCAVDLADGIIASNEHERRALWQMREQIPLAEKQYGYAAKHDISLPLSQIATFLDLNQAKLRHLVPDGYFSIFGHLGDGNLHYNFGKVGCDHSVIAELEKLVSPLVYQDVLTLGGSIAAEHGIGQTKISALQASLNPVNYQLLLTLKRTLDPNYLFNPGKIFAIA